MDLVTTRSSFTSRAEAGRLERIFGEQGNDRLLGNEYESIGGAFIDGGEGDDWLYGTDRDDVLLTNAGIKKIKGFGGDDLIVTTSNGLVDIASMDQSARCEAVRRVPVGQPFSLSSKW